MSNKVTTLDAAQNQLAKRVDKIGPVLAAQRFKTSNNRKLLLDTHRALVSAGFFQACQPAKFGGYELPFGAQTSLGAEIGKYCGASGWIVSVCGTHHWMLGKFSHIAQRDVWGKNSKAIVGSAFASAYQNVEKVEGGFHVSGRWLYSSGINFCQWVIVVGRIKNGHDAPQMWFMLIPKHDFIVEDNWRTVGLKSTGSNDVLVKGAFVPLHRVMTSEDMNKIDTQGSIGEPNSIYKIPMNGIINYCVSAPTLGIAEGAFNHFCAFMKDRPVRNSGGGVNTAIILRTSESAAEIESARLLYEKDISLIQRSVNAGRQLNIEDLARIKRNAAYIGKLTKRAVNRLAESMGAGGLSDENIVHLAYADITAACSHVSMVWDTSAIPYGLAKVDFLSKDDLGV